MKISSFDLNLFVIMNSIYTEGSLTKAAEVVGITQPAVSNALSRLREKFEDDLFVRTGSGMVPTQKTENIIKDIQTALQLMQKSVNEPDEFNPSTSQKTFRISLGDINEGRILGILMGKIEKQAPSIKLECYYTARDQVPHALATNELSFAVDPFIPNSKDTNSMKVFTDQFVIAHRANHPVSNISELTLDEVLKLKYINISNRKRGASVVEMEMQKMQLQPEMALRAQHYLVTPEIVRSTDLCLLCSETFAKKHGLSYVEIPFNVPPLEQYLIWHNSDDNDGSHIWMRDLIAESFEEVSSIKS
ncbi:MAG: LysR family transcriptional regulator [Gammaproteobacteria bacterium]|nr:LysR family transcriptional regulator [Gammaproteobacteria bacterium]